jgi:hypothetical protein
MMLMPAALEVVPEHIAAGDVLDCDRGRRGDRRRRRIALRTVFRETRSSRTIWRIGLWSTKNARLIRPIVSTVTIPATLPRYNQREHSMIPGVGPYSALITPIAGSLFHAVFQPEPVLRQCSMP